VVCGQITERFRSLNRTRLDGSKEELDNDQYRKSDVFLLPNRDYDAGDIIYK